MKWSSRKVAQETSVPGERLRHIFKPKVRSNKALKTLLSWFESTNVAVASKPCSCFENLHPQCLCAL